MAPLRLSPDESFIVTGDGNMFNTADLTRKGGLGMSFVDMAMDDGRYYVLSASEIGSELRVLDADFNLVTASQYPGAPQRVFRINGQTVVTTWDAAASTLLVDRR